MTPNTKRILVIEEVKSVAREHGVLKLSGYQIAKASLAIEQGMVNPVDVFKHIKDLR